MDVRSAELNPPAWQAVPQDRDAPGPDRTGLRPDATAVWLWALLSVASLLLAIVGRAVGVEALALIGGYGVVFFGIGGAPFQLFPKLELYARLTASMLVGFSVLLLAGMLMGDIRGLWDPAVCAVVIGVLALFLHLAGLYRLDRARHGLPGPERAARQLQRLAATERRRSPVSHGRSRTAPELYEAPPTALAPADRQKLRRGSATTAGGPGAVALGLSLSGTVLWLASALLTRDPNPGYWGMLTVLNPLWYAGLALLLAGFALGRRRELTAALPTVSFALATTLTPALVYGAPRDQTASKQMQIVQYVLEHHHIDVTSGIYPAFSSLFSGVAALSQLLGINGMLGHMSLWGVATYWPVVLALLRVVVLRLLMGRLTATTSRCWCGVMLVLLVDSLGDDYFSPQALGYVLAIGIIAIAINGRTRRPFSDRTTFALLALAGMALGPMHELSPYMATGALLVLAVFGQAPLWTAVPVGVPALLWAAVVHKAISGNLNFSSLFNLANFRPPVTVATPGLQRLGVVGVQSHVLLISLLILVLLGAIGFVANIRRRWAWAYALCPIVGIAFIAINPYGNEGIFRATLFAIPWMAVLAMRMPDPSRRMLALARHPDAMTVAIGGVLCTLLGTFLIAAYAMDGTNVLSPHTIAIVDYLDRVPGRAFVLSVGSANDPAAGANFTYRYTALEWSPVVRRQPELQRTHPTAVDASALGDRYGVVAAARRATPSNPFYLIWDHNALLYENAYGLQSIAQTNAWLRVLRASRAWKLVLRSGDTYLFKLT